MNYRNKTIFDWNDFKSNNISSIVSLKIMESLKLLDFKDPINNVIIRDINNQVGIIFQINLNIFNKKDGYIYFQSLEKIVNDLDYELNIFAIQFLNNKIFDNNKNIIFYKKNFITFNVNYLDNKIICLLPNSFYQANINVLHQFYETFIKWINIYKCQNMINLGDDGGNVCTILSSLFSNMISFFHCKSSHECALEMIKLNSLNNLSLTFNLDDIVNFDNKNDNIMLFINPGRKGLRLNEINFINKSNNIKFIIYMACNKVAFEKNMRSLKDNEIIDDISILNMPIINKYQFLYFIKFS